MARKTNRTTRKTQNKTAQNYNKTTKQETWETCHELAKILI